MRDMVLNAPGQPLRLTDVPVPQPGPEQLLLKVEASGICLAGRLRAAAVLEMAR